MNGKAERWRKKGEEVNSLKRQVEELWMRRR
jgi:hypothetical protein